MQAVSMVAGFGPASGKGEGHSVRLLHCNGLVVGLALRSID